MCGCFESSMTSGRLFKQTTFHDDEYKFNMILPLNLIRNVRNTWREYKDYRMLQRTLQANLNSLVILNTVKFNVSEHRTRCRETYDRANGEGRPRKELEVKRRRLRQYDMLVMVIEQLTEHINLAACTKPLMFAVSTYANSPMLMVNQPEWLKIMENLKIREEFDETDIEGLSSLLCIKHTDITTDSPTNEEKEEEEEEEMLEVRLTKLSESTKESHKPAGRYGNILPNDLSIV